MELNAPSKLFLISQTSYYNHKHHIAVAGTIIQSSQWKTWHDTMLEFCNMIIAKFFMVPSMLLSSAVGGAFSQIVKSWRSVYIGLFHPAGEKLS